MRGIRHPPILCTIPTTPKVNNRLKNAWIESSGYRYINFDLAVVENHITGEWFAGTAASDLNHPSELGAKLLYPQVFADFPELAMADSTDCTHKIHSLDAREPDCVNGGRRAYYVCSLCGSAFADSECTIAATTEENLLSALDHTYTAAVTAPTCTSQGYTTYTCDCGDSYVADYVDALGHDMGQWTVVKAPSCTTAGSERRDCSHCDHFEPRVIDTAGHNYNSVATAPPVPSKATPPTPATVATATKPTSQTRQAMRTTRW